MGKNGTGKNNLIIIGGRANTKIAKNIIKNKYNEVYYYADREYNENEFKKEGFICINSFNEVIDIITLGSDYFVGIGGTDLRRAFTEKITNLTGVRPINIISPLAIIEKGVTMGKGNLILHKALININTRVGSNNIFNTGCIVEHDNVIGDYNHIAPGSITGGYVKIGNNNNIFIGSTILPFLKITNNITIAGCSTLTKSINISGTYMGTPAKIVSK